MNDEVLIDSTFLIEMIVEKLKVLRESLTKYEVEDKIKDITICINLGEMILDDTNYFKEVDELWEKCAEQYGPEWPLVNQKKFAEWSTKHAIAEREYKKSIKEFYMFLANYSYDWWL